MYAQVPGSSKSGIVMIDGNGSAIDETTKELHRICDLKSLNIIQWRYPASYEDRQLQIEENMKRMAFPEYIADITRENENRTVAWESRSRARKLIDNARHNELTLIPSPPSSIYRSCHLSYYWYLPAIIHSLRNALAI